MRNALRFSAILIGALGVLTWIAYSVLARTTRDWFEADVALRAQLVVGTARQSLLAHFHQSDSGALHAQLQDISRDQRIMAAAAWAEDGSTIAATDGYPARFSCANVVREIRRTPAKALAAGNGAWLKRTELPGGQVHVAAISLLDGSHALGRIVLIHDLSFALRREGKARNLLLVAFGVLALAASIVTMVAARLARRDWTAELRRILRGDEARPEYLPLLRDVRALVQRLSSEQEQEQRGGHWTPARLKATLSQHLRGERVVIVANREPYIHEHTAEGTVRVQQPASGLVTALEPVMRACSGVWVAHGSGSADRETADANGRIKVPPAEESYVVRRLWLSEAEEQGYYYGFSNEGLWPLCHLADARPTFRAEDFEHYRTVNRRFADAVCAEVDSDDPIVLVQDYHFALAPKMIRERLPRATIISFWHIPWPNSERFGICPWREELLDGMLGSSIIGFHTQLHCNNFFDAVDSYLEARIDRERNAVVQSGRATLVRPYPISTEWPVHWLDKLPSVEECRRGVLEALALPPDTLLGVGVDRLDYTKGIEERLLAVERLLERHPALRGRFVFVQLAAPSRTKIERYRELNEAVERTAARINARYADGPYEPVRLLCTHHEPPSVFRYYRAADVCYVSSLHDGMNLVAKEFVAARTDEQGVLVLSQFTGAARELTEALIVNPYDLDQASDALAAAVQMPKDEQRERMRSMRGLVAEYNVYRWAGRMLVDAAQLRRRERLTGRLARFGMRALGAQ
ncbi:MAG TPA: trehalose-6-phosphate synthase [Polyangiales bacterium]